MGRKLALRPVRLIGHRARSRAKAHRTSLPLPLVKKHHRVLQTRALIRLIT